jgi:hypothetical protein
MENATSKINQDTVHDNWDVDQPRCLSTDEWIKKMLHMCTEEYYLHKKKNEMLAFVAT